jgi:hypothetical protein
MFIYYYLRSHLAPEGEKIPVYTINDCFAFTPNNMFTLEKLVKEVFIEIYFTDEGYLNKLHKHFISEIISATDILIQDENSGIIPDNKPEIVIIDGLIEGDHIYVIDRDTKDIIKIPHLPEG